ncbi:MAG: PIG-L family deacetylase, partial [Candidatus Solibacter usitatus]|nr:PIG-L family deacetylase [Candidatus Solibacter usitatus]
QMARDGLRHQRSQGAGSAISRPGPQVSYYKLLASKVGMAEKEAGFFERIDSSLPPELARPVAEAVEAFSMNHPEACAPALARALEAASRILPEKLPSIRRALEQSLGLTLDARVEPKNPRAGPFASFQPSETFSLATPGQTFPVAVTLYGAPAVKTELLVPPGFAVRETGPGRFSVTVPEHPPYTQAYWRRDSVRESSYRIEDPRRFTRPLPEAPVRARVTYRVGAVEATIERAVETGFLDTLGVEHRKTLAVGPPIAVRFSTEAGVLPLGKREYDLACTVRSHVDGKAAGAVRIGLPSGWRSEPAQAPFAFEKEKEETILNFRVIAPAGAPAAEYKLEAVAAYNGREYRDSFREVTQPGLSSVYLAAPAVHLLRVADVKVAPGLRAGYVMGTGDQVPEGLRQLGVPVDLLDRTALESGDLSRYSTILLGIRAYAARDDVKAFNGRLLEYVRNGGVLIVQYNTPEYDRNYGPYPYTMGRNPEEVSEEDSPVRILEPSHPVFTTPNRITLKDFEGWVEQRGSKFWTTWDPRYTALLETHDTGQPPQRGGWLVAPYGKGLYVYCAYAWYRQLPYAVPGAVRLFANLVSLGAR